MCEAYPVKMTDTLLHCHQLSVGGSVKESVELFERLVLDRFVFLAKELSVSMPEDFGTEAQKVRLILQSEDAECRDYLASRGEYFQAMLFSRVVSADFVDAARVLFFCEADGLIDETRTSVALLEECDSLSEKTYCIPGFYGSYNGTEVRVFPRGGSDTSAAWIASLLRADLCEIWTDVPGVYRADPRILNSADVESHIVPFLSHAVMYELSFGGATVVAQEALDPLRRARVPMEVRSTFSPEKSGTRVVDISTHEWSSAVLGSAGKAGFAQITLHRIGVNAQVGYGEQLFSYLRDCGIPYDHTPTGVGTISVILQEKHLTEDVEAQLRAWVEDQMTPDEFTVHRSIAVFTIAGESISMVVVGEKLFRALRDVQVEPYFVSWPGKYSVTVGVPANKLGDVTVAAHRAFFS